MTSQIRGRYTIKMIHSIFTMIRIITYGCDLFTVDKIEHAILLFYEEGKYKSFSDII